MSEVTDFHQLDECTCGGTLDCWTTKWTEAERLESGLPNAHFRSEWICQKCGDVSDRYHDADMNDITIDEAAGEA